MNNMTKLVKEHKKKLHGLCKALKDEKAIRQWLDYFYEKITSDDERGDEEKYDFCEIIRQSDIVGELTYKFNNKAVIFEFLKYRIFPKQFMMIYLEFDNKKVIDLNIYILKDENLRQTN